MDDNNEDIGDLSSVNDAEEPTHDTVFEKMFVESKPAFDTLRELDFAVDNYEQSSGYRILIRRSEEFARTYHCGSHSRCCFRAKFGRDQKAREGIFLKPELSKLFHCGKDLPPKSAGGRAYKKRLKGRLEPSVHSVSIVKADDPAPRDIMKAAANLGGRTATYNQSFRVCGSTKSAKHKRDLHDFELIIPYLEKFMELNPESTVRWERDNENHIERFFVCPGIMKTSMRYVRPVMSLDACHLSSFWKGILYIASVKTGSNEIYPVAVSVMRDNENEEGWTWFLGHLRSAIEVLVMDHPIARVRYKYFTFMSDRQKGLINALETIFPLNHACYCAVHIRRNVDCNAGKKVGAYVHRLATTFSRRLAAEYLSEVEKISVKGREYLDGIPALQWRNTAWLDDLGLPPRFGIETTNMSESTNAMLVDARKVSWLQCLDTILAKMAERISTLRSKYRETTGTVEHVAGELAKRWDKCAGYRVVELEEGGGLFSVYHPAKGVDEPPTRFTINIVERSCECGIWQNHGVPCVDAVAYYFRHRAGLSLPYVVNNMVHEMYTYSIQAELLKRNIVPVCMETIAHDGTTLPPIIVTKTSGRPRVRRIRNRSAYVHEPDKTKIKCSNCGQKGHNVRTCLARQEMLAEGANNRNRTTATDVS